MKGKYKVWHRQKQSQEQQGHPKKSFPKEARQCGEFTVHMIQICPNAEFRPSHVEMKDKRLWSFKGDHPGYKGRSRLIEVDGVHLIMLYDKNYLEYVLPLADLPIARLENGELIGGRNVRNVVKLKEQVATMHGLTPVWTQREFDTRSPKPQHNARKPERTSRRDRDYIAKAA